MGHILQLWNHIVFSSFDGEISTYESCFQILPRIAASKYYGAITLKLDSILVNKMLFDSILRTLSFGMHAKNIWKFKPENS